MPVEPPPVPREHTVYRRNKDGRRFIVVDVVLSYEATGESDHCYLEDLRKRGAILGDGRKITLKGLARNYTKE